MTGQRKRHAIAVLLSILTVSASAQQAASGFYIFTDKPGVEVHVDGVRVGTTEQGVGGIWLKVDRPPGTYQVECVLEYASARFTVEVKHGEYTDVSAVLRESSIRGRSLDPESVEMRFARGAIRVRSVPPRATVLINGRAVSQRTPADFEVDAGLYEIEVRISGSAPLTTRFELGADEVVTVIAEFTPTRSITNDARSYLSFVTQPDGVLVYLDGRLAGATPLTDVEVAAGRHTMVLTKPGYRRIEETIEVAEPAIIQREMTRMPVVRVTTQPAGAEIVVDGKVIGESPVSFLADALRHRVTARLDRHHQEEQVITANRDQAVRFDMRLIGATISVGRDDRYAPPITVELVTSGNERIKALTSQYNDPVEVDAGSVRLGISADGTRYLFTRQYLPMNSYTITPILPLKETPTVTSAESLPGYVAPPPEPEYRSETRRVSRGRDFSRFTLVAPASFAAAGALAGALAAADQGTDARDTALVGAFLGLAIGVGFEISMLPQKHATVPDEDAIAANRAARERWRRAVEDASARNRELLQAANERIERENAAIRLANQDRKRFVILNVDTGSVDVIDYNR